MILCIIYLFILHFGVDLADMYNGTQLGVLMQLDIQCVNQGLPEVLPDATS